VREGCGTMFGGWNYGQFVYIGGEEYGNGQAGIFTLSR